MKRFILLAIILIGTALGIYAETFDFYAEEMSTRVKQDGSWQKWSEWENVNNTPVSIDSNSSMITIQDGSSPLKFRIRSVEENVADDNGTSVKFQCTDDDGDACVCRLRKQKNNGRLQLYIDYDSGQMAFNLKRR